VKYEDGGIQAARYIFTSWTL